MAIITTTHGPLDEALLVKREGIVDNDDERTTWVEYWIGDPDSEGELVHRSAHVTLKKWPDGLGAIAAKLG